MSLSSSFLPTHSISYSILFFGKQWFCLSLAYSHLSSWMHPLYIHLLFLIYTSLSSAPCSQICHTSQCTHQSSFPSSPIGNLRGKIYPRDQARFSSLVPPLVRTADDRLFLRSGVVDACPYRRLLGVVVRLPRRFTSPEPAAACKTGGVPCPRPFANRPFLASTAIKPLSPPAAVRAVVCFPRWPAVLSRSPPRAVTASSGVCPPTSSSSWGRAGTRPRCLKPSRTRSCRRRRSTGAM